MGREFRSPRARMPRPTQLPATHRPPDGSRRRARRRSLPETGATRLPRRRTGQTTRLIALDPRRGRITVAHASKTINRPARATSTRRPPRPTCWRPVAQPPPACRTTALLAYPPSPRPARTARRSGRRTTARPPRSRPCGRTQTTPSSPNQPTWRAPRERCAPSRAEPSSPSRAPPPSRHRRRVVDPVQHSPARQPPSAICPRGAPTVPPTGDPAPDHAPVQTALRAQVAELTTTTATSAFPSATGIRERTHRHSTHADVPSCSLRPKEQRADVASQWQRACTPCSSS